MDSQRISYAQARRIYPLKKPTNFWNRFTFLNKHLILFRSLKEPFSGILMNISNCQAFCPFETMPSNVIRGVKFPSCRQPSDKKKTTTTSDTVVSTSSENLSPKKPNQFLDSVGIP